ncbi:MAG: response regulator [Alphaproteobacteria bacterium]|uniref:endopeptidase La n=1 Tax=Candidatus Nitrobium versatile TaxID=2884831 RepID=A0A953JDG8_9BACT|nr:response regulator [Candidatus Nitrobium versatile]
MKFFRKSEEDEQEAVLDELRQKIADAKMPPEVEKVALQELETLSKISPSASEYTIGLTYIDYLVSLPWNRRTEDTLDLNRAERILNEGHYGLYAVKERILEHMAVKVLVANRKPRLLIVDDEEIARKNLFHVLSRDSYEVYTAADGNEALDRLRSMEFDAVITDIKMPGKDGIEILEHIRTKYPDTRVIIITGYATVPSAVEAMKKGAFYYIAKPFKLEEVRTTLRQALEERKEARSVRGSVLCFAGPPGTGKTSMGRAVARALGRKFARISLGGMRDEAEIRGHRRTYVGARPGRIIEEIRRAEAGNPVVMLDELDKIGHDFKGDPDAALLEVLDPEQNHSFVDHYLDVPFDLSGVLFILTANVVENVQTALRDRMEVIEFSGYTQEEKAEIAARFLIPRQIRDKGLSAHSPVFRQEAVYKIINEYTHEAGTRSLERKIADICRKIARDTVSGAGTGPVEVDSSFVEHCLGQRRYLCGAPEKEDRVGVTAGLVWAESGGEIILVEAAKMRGKKELILTGSLGEVMKESAQAALSYIRSNAESFGIPDDFFEHHDIHIHVPSGAIRKDGPSAGITIAMALLSLLTGRPARREVALSGEITLTGRILPVGGIKEKILAAKRACITDIVLPEANRPETDALPDAVKGGIALHLVSSIEEAARLVLRERHPRTL